MWCLCNGINVRAARTRRSKPTMLSEALRASPGGGATPSLLASPALRTGTYFHVGAAQRLEPWPSDSGPKSLFKGNLKKSGATQKPSSCVVGRVESRRQRYPGSGARITPETGNPVWVPPGWAPAMGKADPLLLFGICSQNGTKALSTPPGKTRQFPGAQ